MKNEIKIPNKSLFKIEEVCELIGIKPYVLRFWESEFSEIGPMSSASGQKLYDHGDIELLIFIKKLLFGDKLTIEQAKRELYNFIKSNNLAVKSRFAEHLPQTRIQHKKSSANKKREEQLELVKSKLQILVAASDKFMSSCSESSF